MGIEPLDFYTVARLVSDTGLFILIWIVQLVVYPGFGYYEHNNLKVWHDLYTKRITIVVMPLMLIQLSLSVYSFISNWDNALQIFDTLLVLLTWITTFLVFVPLHNSIAKGLHVTSSVHKLVKYNWYRTVLWSALFFLTLYCMQ